MKASQDLIRNTVYYKLKNAKNIGQERILLVYKEFCTAKFKLATMQSALLKVIATPRFSRWVFIEILVSYRQFIFRKSLSTIFEKSRVNSYLEHPLCFFMCNENMRFSQKLYDLGQRFSTIFGTRPTFKEKQISRTI